MVDDRLDGSMARREAERRKFRVGLVLFVVYIVGYTLFTLAGTFFKGVLMLRLGGLNLGIVSGMLIIVSAIVIAVLYNWFAGKTEAE
ncbi:MAG: DUF485 domain-containing protein [Candidatus Bathyarchaeota archaeon]|jgi:uncharacterized membrane protein (DUF485 family)|nr:DUF485 domain-containing protein [Candidatus Bathyarchaeota archaeon]